MDHFSSTKNTTPNELASLAPTSHYGKAGGAASERAGRGHWPSGGVGFPKSLEGSGKNKKFSILVGAV